MARLDRFSLMMMRWINRPVPITVSFKEPVKKKGWRDFHFPDESKHTKKLAKRR